MQKFDEKALAWMLQIKKFGNLIGGTALLCFVLMVLGAAVRATDSGLACPDWPLCHNQVIPTFDMHIFLEWLHRVVAGTLTLFVIAALVIIKRHKILRFEFGRPLAFACVLLVIQIILGAFTIFHLLDPKVVSFHLINALFFFSILVWMHNTARSRVDTAGSSAQNASNFPLSFRLSLASMCILILVQIFLGGMVSTNHAGLACPDFPQCHGSWLPEMSFLVGLQVFHRITAFLLLILAVSVSLVCSRIKIQTQLPPFAALLIHCVPFLIVVQIGLGMVNVFYQLPRWASISHLGTALLIYTFAFKAFLLLSSKQKVVTLTDAPINLVRQRSFLHEPTS